jgi:hypothetical protein
MSFSLWTKDFSSCESSIFFTVYDCTIIAVPIQAKS